MEQALIQILTDEANGLGIFLSPAEQAQFSLFYDEFQVWNAKMNLTALEAGSSFIIKHFIDSLQALQLIPQEAKTLLDLGTGGGFPGVPLKIARSDLSLTLLDSSRKKTSFLKQVVLRLGLSDVHVITDRAEEQAREGRGGGEFDVVISRATFKMSRILELGSHFVKRDGLIIAMKGRDVTEELEKAQTVMNRFHLRLAERRETTLPRLGDSRTFFVYKKD